METDREVASKKWTKIDKLVDRLEFLESKLKNINKD